MEEKHTASGISTPVAIIIGSIIISIAILIHGGSIKIKGFEAQRTAAEDSGVPTPKVPSEPDEPTGPVTVSLDDDPVLGDKNAPVTIVEFSDYECPFCKRHYDETWPQLKKDYVDTGKVKIVFRDLPLSFHDPMATTEAVAANCVREQGGDSKYFDMHDLMFENTTSNGNGLKEEDLSKFAVDLGMNEANFKTCLDSDKYSAEVAKDLEDASAYGASGTPTFFIGKSEDGKTTGTKVVGAQPYSTFKTLIDELL